MLLNLVCSYRLVELTYKQFHWFTNVAASFFFYFFPRSFCKLSTTKAILLLNNTITLIVWLWGRQENHFNALRTVLTTHFNGKDVLFYVNKTCYLKNRWTKPGLVCTQLDAFFMPIPNMDTKVNNSKLFWKKIAQFIQCCLQMTATWNVLSLQIDTTRSAHAFLSLHISLPSFKHQFHFILTIQFTLFQLVLLIRSCLDYETCRQWMSSSFPGWLQVPGVSKCICNTNLGIYDTCKVVLGQWSGAPLNGPSVWPRLDYFSFGCLHDILYGFKHHHFKF